ncbi:MAG: FAD synthetase family protein [Chlamydiales bacterium]|nr:FAD synthetase family protein [Chlamydiales bacterium]
MAIFNRLQKEPVLDTPCVFTFGTFDGVHLGHKHIFDAVAQEAKRAKQPTALLTFSNHPSSVLTPEESSSWLTSNSQKLANLKPYGFTVLIDIPFTDALRELTADQFIKVIRMMVPFSTLVVGPDVSFGKDRKGNEKFLKKQEKEFNSIFVEKYAIDGLPVSSTVIRQAITEGNFEQAQKLLGRPYTIDVKRTDETEWDPLHYTLPPKGIYQAQIRYNDQEYWHEADVKVSSILEINERNEDSHSAEIQFTKFLREIA